MGSMRYIWQHISLTIHTIYLRYANTLISYSSLHEMNCILTTSDMFSNDGQILERFSKNCFRICSNAVQCKMKCSSFSIPFLHSLHILSPRGIFLYLPSSTKSLWALTLILQKVEISALEFSLDNKYFSKRYSFLSLRYVLSCFH